MRYVALLVCTLFCLAASGTPEDSSASGAWTFIKAVDHGNLSVPLTAPQSTAISLTGDTLQISPTCSVHIRKRTYYAGGPFQGLLKSGQTETSIASFMRNMLNFDLNGPKAYYEVDESDCNKFAEDLLVSADELIAIRGGEYFYSFAKKRVPMTRTQAGPASGAPSLKVTALPFTLSDYTASCSPAMYKGVPVASAKCSPAYYYHVATQTSTDTLSRLVGAHNYKRGGARFATDDYDNPVSHGLHPVFLVFAAMGDVTVVRVDDFEARNEQRDPISGAYLAIKNGRVTDEINFGCDLDAEYICSGDGRRVKLTSEGKFQSIGG